LGNKSDSGAADGPGRYQHDRAVVKESGAPAGAAFTKKSEANFVTYFGSNF
jgi:hypothetical protein